MFCLCSIDQAVATEEDTVRVPKYTWAGVPCSVVAVADSKGAVHTADPHGFDLVALLAHKRGGASVHAYEGQGAVQAVDAIEALTAVKDFDILFEASPVNLDTGGVGLAGVKAALAKGKDAVLANKAPLVLEYAELHAAAAAAKCRLEFSATVCGGLPVSSVVHAGACLRGRLCNPLASVCTRAANSAG